MTSSGQATDSCGHPQAQLTCGQHTFRRARRWGGRGVREDSEPGAWQLHRPASPSGKVGDSPALGPTLLPSGHITFTPYAFILSGVGWGGGGWGSSFSL